jgi:hypothetical protein
MKTLKMFAIGMITLTGISVSNSTLAQPGFRANVSFGTFYNELRPYGRWVNMPRYGQVWIYKDANFRPYQTNGYWEDTDLGWAWQSAYPWGWAPFHYGRWEFEPAYGWFWIPGYQYAPAWVAWSQADDYYGWAPLGFGVDINISIGKIPANRWMYAQTRYMGHRSIDRYSIPYQRNNYYYQRQKPVTNIHVYNNVTYRSGPRGNNHRNNEIGSRPEYRRNEGRRNGEVQNRSRVEKRSSGRKLENKGQRQRILKAEASR